MKPNENMAYLNLLVGIVGNDPDMAADDAITLWGENAAEELRAAADSWYDPYKATALEAIERIKDVP